MGMKGIIKTILRKLLLYTFTHVRLDERIAHVCMLTPMALRRISDRGLEISSILDVGASNGRWSLEARKFWPQARSHLIEANPYHQKELESRVKEIPNFSYTLAAAGSDCGEIFFDYSDPFGGLADRKSHSGQNWIRVPMTTIDAEVKKYNLLPPYLIKLDTHGFEVDILKGAKETLTHTNLLVIETYNFDIAPESIIFYEMCSFMDRLGFRVIDISEPLWRIKDRTFWQMDLFFVKKDRPEFLYSQYK